MEAIDNLELINTLYAINVQTTILGFKHLKAPK
jgi:hypothetical protein